MEQLIELHESLINTANDKKRAIADNNIQLLTSLMTQENRLVKQIATTEQRRLDYVSIFLKEKGIRSQLNLTVTELSRLVFDNEDKQRLLDVKDRLLSSVHLLKKENKLVEQLLEQSLEFIDFSLNIIVGVDDDLIYQNPSQPLAGYKKNNFFDSKI